MMIPASCSGQQKCQLHERKKTEKKQKKATIQQRKHQLHPLLADELNGNSHSTPEFASALGQKKNIRKSAELFAKEAQCYYTFHNEENKRM